MILEKIFESATPKKVNSANLPPGKIYLKIETPGKITIKGPPGLLHPYPCTDKKWSSPMFFVLTYLNKCSLASSYKKFLLDSFNALVLINIIL